MKQQFMKSTADNFQTYIYENNRRIIPQSAFINIFRPGGAELIATTSMSIGADGALSYSLSQNDNNALGINYKAVITYTHNSKTFYSTLFYDVVNSRLSKVVTDEDIIVELPQLKDNGWKIRGTAQSGSTTSIVDNELKRYDDDYFTGGLACSVDKDETRAVIDFESATGTVTTEAFSSLITANEKYILTRSFSKEIQRAFEKIEERLSRLGRRPHLILDPYDLREAHIYFSVAEVCKGLVTDNDNLWWKLWKDYEKKADDAFNQINFKYDYSEDGLISGAEANAGINVITAGRR
ncbi:MAG: hypothetical protein HYS21_13705 [Deltaproteobacteria bacterium]|nr:hypothetical protein [Deltaproteobacteria bacterium]